MATRTPTQIRCLAALLEIVLLPPPPLPLLTTLSPLVPPLLRSAISVPLAPPAFLVRQLMALLEEPRVVGSAARALRER